MSLKLYANIIIPGALRDSFTYSVGQSLSSEIKVGSRVIVPFGRGRNLIGIVERLHSDNPGIKGIKEIAGVPSYISAISQLQLKFWTWISSYYMCAKGEVLDAALPSGLKLFHLPSALPFEQRYKPRLIPLVGLSREFDEKYINTVLDKYESGSPAKFKLLSWLLESISFDDQKEEKYIPKDEIVKQSGVSGATLQSMIKQDVLTIKYIEETRLDSYSGEIIKPLVLSGAQNLAFEAIKDKFKTKNTVLLKGVTSSGKTEIYIHLIQEQLDAGKQVLYLLPEIALTTQIINRLRKFFGNDIGVYHSRFSDNERVEVWRRISGKTKNPYKIILGVRSSLFLPFDKLGLIIVDEEHDGSYKQKDPAPRYNARDSAIVLAGLHDAKVLLGSASPSIESVYNCRSDKYGLVELNSRFGDVKLPEIEIADTREAYRRKIMVSHFTPQLIKATEEALERGEQVVFFRNRRGYAPVIICNECGWTPVCPDCSVNKTYHKGINLLKCHYCGHKSENTGICGNCGSTDMKMKGFGTEKIEDEISILFPEARVGRMDLDTTRKKGSIDGLISKLEKGKIDILVGTQMISKGLDFENLTLVGVLNVDNMLFLPDFRAGERCFQMIEQVSGRAGRRKKQGRVIIQSLDPYNTVIKQAIFHDYYAMYDTQIDERREFGYPPFTRIIKLHLKHKDKTELSRAATSFAETLRANLSDIVLGPEYPVISRVQTFYFMTVLIKVDRKSGDIAKVKRKVHQSIDYIYTMYKKNHLRIYADVDPV
jgi:primosomal protein N' (replication factor Y)